MNRLNNLNIEVPEEFFKVTYLGEVKDEKSFYKAIFECLRKKYKSNRFTIDDHFNKFFKTFREDKLKSRGYCAGYALKVGNKPKETRIFITHTTGLSATEKVYVGGHEETHGLDEYGHIDMLENRLKTKGVSIALQKYDKEHRAVIGGLYALALNGTDNVTFEKLRNPRHKDILLLTYSLGI